MPENSTTKHLLNSMGEMPSRRLETPLEKSEALDMNKEQADGLGHLRGGLNFKNKAMVEKLDIVKALNI